MSVYICEEHQSKVDLACPVCWQKKCIEARDEQIIFLKAELTEKDTLQKAYTQMVDKTIGDLKGKIEEADEFFTGMEWLLNNLVQDGTRIERSAQVMEAFDRIKQWKDLK